MDTSMFGGKAMMAVGALVVVYALMGNMIFIFIFLALISLYFQLIVYQESMLYIPQPQGFSTVDVNPEGFRSPRDMNMQYEDVYFMTPDGLKLHAWWIPCSARSANSKDVPTILFCHANAGNIGFRLPNFKMLQRAFDGRINIFAFDYRGFGSSEGTPSEHGLILDAIAAAQWLKQQAESGQRVDINNIYVFGRSLGGAVAVALTHCLCCLQPEPLFKIKGLVLENTFTSISGMVDFLFSWIPKPIKNRFLRLKWETDKKIIELNVPILFLSGQKDEIVPAHHMATLRDLCGEYATFKPFAEGTHNDTWEKGGEEYWSAWREFIEKQTAS